MLRALLALVLALPLLLPVGVCPCRWVEPADAPADDDAPCCREESPTQLNAERPQSLTDLPTVLFVGRPEPFPVFAGPTPRPAPSPAVHDPPAYLRFGSLTL